MDGRRLSRKGVAQIVIQYARAPLHPIKLTTDYASVNLSR